MSVIATIVDLICNIVPTWNVLVTNAKDTIGKFNEQATKELEKAQEVIDDKDNISVDLYHEIVRICDGAAGAIEVLTAKALATEKWIKYTFYYLTDPSAVKIACDKESAALVNGIAKFVMPDLDPIYQNEAVANIDKYDAQDIATDKVKFILDKEDIKKRFNTSMVEAANAKLMAQAAEEVPVEEEVKVPVAFEESTESTPSGRIDENGLYHPVFTVNKDDLKKEIESRPMKPEGMTQDQCDMFNRVLTPFIGARKHYYTLDERGNVCLNIVDGECMVNTYIVDDGTIMGGEKLSIMGNCMSPNGLLDTVFVDVNKHPSIVNRILSPAFYVMSPSEVAEVSADMFSSGLIYRMVDFSGTPFMDTGNMTSALEKAMNAVLSLNVEDARVRFASFVDPAHFELVSDDKCKSKLADVTSSNIVEGLKYVIDGNIITKIVGGKGTRYQF